MILRDVVDELISDFKKNNYYLPMMTISRYDKNQIGSFQLDNVICVFNRFFNEAFPANNAPPLFRFSPNYTHVNSAPAVGLYPTMTIMHPCTSFFKLTTLPLKPIVILSEGQTDYTKSGMTVYTGLELAEESIDLLGKNFFDLSYDCDIILWEKNQKFFDSIIDVDHFLENHYPDENFGLSEDLIDLIGHHFGSHYGIPFTRLLRDPYWREDYIHTWKKKQQECDDLLYLLR